MLRETTHIKDDKGYYFSNPTYTNLRELVCHERPLLFVLHYFFGVDVPYDLLLDRFKFHFTDENEFQCDGNMMADFFRAYGIAKPTILSEQGEEIYSALQFDCQERTAIIVPLKKEVAGQVLASSVLVEASSYESSTNKLSHVAVTSLRGDDFYIRRVMPVEDLIEHIAFEHGKEVATMISIPSLLVSEDIGIRTAFKMSFNAEISTYAAAMAKKPYIGAGFRPSGAEALKRHLEACRQEVTKYEQLARSGFNNVLLAKVLWPMTFCYLPYVIALRERSDAVRVTLESIGELSGLATNLGSLWAKSPSIAKANRFFAIIDQIIAQYQQIDPLTTQERTRHV